MRAPTRHWCQCPRYRGRSQAVHEKQLSAANPIRDDQVMREQVSGEYSGLFQPVEKFSDACFQFRCQAVVLHQCFERWRNTAIRTANQFAFIGLAKGGLHASVEPWQMRPDKIFVTFSEQPSYGALIVRDDLLGVIVEPMGS